MPRHLANGYSGHGSLGSIRAGPGIQGPSHPPARNRAARGHQDSHSLGHRAPPWGKGQAEARLGHWPMSGGLAQDQQGPWPGTGWAAPQQSLCLCCRSKVSGLKQQPSEGVSPGHGLPSEQGVSLHLAQPWGPRCWAWGTMAVGVAWVMSHGSQAGSGAPWGYFWDLCSSLVQGGSGPVPSSWCCWGVIIESRVGGEARGSNHSWGHKGKLGLLLRGFVAVQRPSGATEAFRTWGWDGCCRGLGLC